MLHALSSIIANTLMITGFVLVMMLVVEYFNIVSRGWLGEKMARSGWLQILFAAFLGATPGCLGAFTVVALFSHRALSLGALTAAMIATSGDEAFVMFALIPRTALPLTLALLALGFVAGWLTDRIVGKRRPVFGDCCDEMEVHAHHVERFSLRNVPRNFRQLSFPRALLVGGALLVIFGVASGYLMAHDHEDHGHAGHDHAGRMEAPAETAPGIDAHAHDGHDHAARTEAPAETALGVDEHAHDGHDHHDHDHAARVEAPAGGEALTGDPEGHDHAHADEGKTIATPAHDGPVMAHGEWSWLRITFLALALVALAIVTLAPEHFLDEHLWRHVVRRHLPPLLIWTFAALLALELLGRLVDTGGWLRLSPGPLVGAAALLGLIPQSGPHLIFVAAFAKGLAPLAALVTSSIVQDGHGMLPLLAHSRRAFFLVKGINLLVGLIVGGLMLLL